MRATARAEQHHGRLRPGRSPPRPKRVTAPSNTWRTSHSTRAITRSRGERTTFRGEPRGWAPSRGASSSGPSTTTGSSTTPTSSTPRARPTGRPFPTSIGRPAMQDFGAYLQDSWRAAPGLTVNAGLRWDGENGVNDAGEDGSPPPHGLAAAARRDLGSLEERRDEGVCFCGPFLLRNAHRADRGLVRKFHGSHHLQLRSGQRRSGSQRHRPPDWYVHRGRMEEPPSMPASWRRIRTS